VATRPATPDGAQSDGMSQAKPALSVAETAFAAAELQQVAEKGFGATDEHG